MKGLVIRSTGSWYEVKVNDRILKCRLKGKFRIEGLKLTNPVAVGDNVILKEEEEGIGTIIDIEPRSNYVIRQSPRKKHFLHILASNIDQALVIVTICNPKLKQGFIDRFLLMTAPYDIPVTIVFNKADLYSPEDLDVFHYLKEIYQKIGYQAILSSAMNQLGVDEIKQLLTNKISLISGQSGVGKSTIVNCLQPGLELKTGDISDYTGKGQHTTTFAEMLDLDFGGSIIDTPGIKTLSYNHLEIMDIAHNFKEFFEASVDCKFANCTHRNEPQCAVKAKLETGEISELRYFNYLAIIEETEEQNYWERNKDY